MALDGSLSDKPKPVQAYEMLQAGYTKKEISVWFGWSMAKTHVYCSRGKNYEAYLIYTRANHKARYVALFGEKRLSIWDKDPGLLKLLQDLWRDGFSSGRIAEMAPFKVKKISRSAVMGKLDRLGLVGHGRERKKPSTAAGQAFKRGPQMQEIEL